MPNLFQQYKTRTSVHLSVTLLSTMATRRRRTHAAEHSVLPKLVTAPDFDTCNFYVEAVNPVGPEESPTSTSLFHRRRQNQIRLRRFLPQSRLPTLRRIWSRKKERVNFDHS